MTIRLYKTYRFLDKDPVIDKLRTIYQTKSCKSVEEVAANSGLAPGTIKGWFYGATKRPQFASCQAAAKAMGHQLVLVPVQQRKEKKT
mgnify:CR=1 FL=1